MPYRKILQELMDKYIISGCVILDPYGNTWWHTGAFPQVNGALLDGYYLIYEWVTYPPSIRVAGVEYNSILNAYPDYWCLTNPEGHGSLVLQVTKNKYFFLCYLKDDEPIEIQKEIAKMTALFG